MFFGLFSTGSSPLARGLLVVPGLFPAPPRIIPARAGFTRAGHAPSTSPMDHPRSRGVYVAAAAGVTRQTGSSPLARGLPDAGDHGERGGRIIPARAGFTPHGSITTGCRTDHPRSRGVYGRKSRAPLGPVGSSPLARGLHLRILGIPTTSHTTRPRSPSLPT